MSLQDDAPYYADLLTYFNNSPYSVGGFVMDESRRLMDVSPQHITAKEAVTWAIRDTPPKFEKVVTYAENYLDDVLSNIDDDNVREAVEASFLLSKSRQNLLYDYKMVNNLHYQAKVRILTRMLWFHLCNT